MRFLILPLLWVTFLFADSIEVENASLRTTFESVKLSKSEDMGLVGLNYLLEANDNFYYGVGMYGAVAGDRGGFFVGGFTAGLKYELIKNIYFDSGAFVGGGGGASAGQGGGLMLKAYAGGLYRFNHYSLGLHYSYIDFPNGAISSEQIAVVADMRFKSIFVEETSGKSDYKNYYFKNNKDYLVGTYQTYFPKNGTKTRSGALLIQNVNLLGIEYGANISDDFIAYFESAGAMGGQSTGYMEVLGGIGYVKELTNYANFGLKVSLGGAGGGQIDTGGGAISKASIHLSLNPIKDVNIGVDGGYIHALEGGFDAPFAKINLGVNANFLSISDVKSEINYDSIATQKFNIRFANQTYLYSDTLSTNLNNKESVQLLGMKLDWFLTDELYLSGQAYGAYKGGAGGYAVGMFSLGYIQPLFYDFSAVVEFGFGAGGGGSINSGGGNIAQPMAGFMYNITKNVSIEIMYGKVIAFNGELDTNIVDVGLVYRFNKPVLK